LDRLDRDDVAGWLDSLASGGHFSRRSVEICRTVLKAALTDAVDEGLIPRNPAARVPLPKQVAKPARVKEIDAGVQFRSSGSWRPLRIIGGRLAGGGAIVVAWPSSSRRAP
jgi:hypothetical protein